MRTLLFVLIVIIGKTSYAGPISIQKYIKIYQDQDETLKNSKLSYDSAKESLIISEDLFQTLISITPSLTQSEMTSRNGGTTTLKPEESQYSLGLSQSFPTGTTLSIDYTENLDFEDSLKSITKNTTSLTIAQSLWKNPFGLRSSAQVEQSRKNLENFKNRYFQSKLSSCRKAVEIYVGTYKTQEQLRIYKALLEDANSALSLTQRNYRRRLVRKIDLLSAKSDHLNVKAKKRNGEKLHFERVANFKNQARLKDSEFQLFFTDKDLNDLSSSGFDVDRSFAVQSSLSEWKAAELSAKVTDYDQRNELQLLVSAGQSEFVPTTGTEFEEQFIKFALQWDWSIFKESRKANRTISFYEKERAKNNYLLSKKSTQELYDRLRESSVGNQSLLNLSRQKIDVYNQQGKEALRLLRAGKLEFQDYIRFRDLRFNEQLNEYEILSTLVSDLSQIAEISNDAQSLCMEKL